MLFQGQPTSWAAEPLAQGCSDMRRRSMARPPAHNFSGSSPRHPPLVNQRLQVGGQRLAGGHHCLNLPSAALPVLAALLQVVWWVRWGSGGGTGSGGARVGAGADGAVAPCGLLRILLLAIPHPGGLPPVPPELPTAAKKKKGTKPPHHHRCIVDKAGECRLLARQPRAPGAAAVAAVASLLERRCADCQVAPLSHSHRLRVQPGPVRQAVPPAAGARMGWGQVGPAPASAAAAWAELLSLPCHLAHDALRL